MKKIGLLIFLVIFWNCKQKEETDLIAENLKTYTIEQMMNNENIGGESFSPDLSKLLLPSNRSGIYNMYTVAVEGGPFQDSSSMELQTETE